MKTAVQDFTGSMLLVCRVQNEPVMRALSNGRIKATIQICADETLCTESGRYFSLTLYAALVACGLLARFVAVHVHKGDSIVAEVVVERCNAEKAAACNDRLTLIKVHTIQILP